MPLRDVTLLLLYSIGIWAFALLSPSACIKISTKSVQKYKKDIYRLKTHYKRQ